MNNILLTFFSILIAFSSAGCDSSNVPRKIPAAVVVEDDLGVRHNFNKIPNRIVTLAPSLTEYIYKLGLDSLLIANTTYCNYPEDAENKIKVGDLLSADYEKIISLKPDLIFISVEGNSKAVYEKLLKLGLRVFVSNPRDYEGVKNTLKNIAEIFGIPDKAENIILNWDKIIADSSLIGKKSALFVVSVNPLITAGKNTFINEIMTYSGLINAAGKSPVNYPVFSREEVLKLNPDILISTMEKNDFINDALEVYPEWKILRAIKNRAIISVEPDKYLRPGPRFAEAVKDLRNLLHSRHQGKNPLNYFPQ